MKKTLLVVQAGLSEDGKDIEVEVTVMPVTPTEAMAVLSSVAGALHRYGFPVTLMHTVIDNLDDLNRNPRGGHGPMPLVIKGG